ncbi:MAG: L-threonylcarbamoyladenylate synthase [Niastella sp.]|jgi:L-threonylcarbamoyladenylate synthase|uniref:L-threonylcarbamoyladenylate synthase n=1 Tax=Niastella sp. TaxID=1869183 RepID=UPI00389A6841
MDFAHDVDHCLKVLQGGGLILYPTDTIWGIGCDATNATAVNRIFNLKQRPEAKSMIILLADVKELMQYVAHIDLQVFDYLAKVKKPTTVIYEGAIGLADNVINADGTVAIRIVKDNFCKHLIKRFRKPIVSTSANISGDPAPAIFHDISPAIWQGVDYIVQHRQKETTAHAASSIIKWNKDGSVTVIRE